MGTYLEKFVAYKGLAAFALCSFSFGNILMFGGYNFHTRATELKAKGDTSVTHI